MAPTALARGDLYALERRLRRFGFRRVAGADEAGRGACAGPLVAAAVCLPDGARSQLPGLADSKLLTPQRREELYEQIQQRARLCAVVVVPSGEIDVVGVHRANLAALRRTVSQLGSQVDYALTDGFGVSGISVPNLGVWKGDRVAACIAAASIVAKVTRDRLMCQLDERFPQYEFAGHKGYITAAHTRALHEYGPCSEHRRSFANVRSLAESELTGVVGGSRAAWSTILQR
ncbi:MAG: ribonuclease HII [Mycobacteriales bacterium]